MNETSRYISTLLSRLAAGVALREKEKTCKCVYVCFGEGGHVGGGVLAESPPGRSPFPLADLHTDAGLWALQLLIFGDPQAMPVPRSDQNRHLLC